MPPPIMIADSPIAIGLSAPLNFMIPRFKSDISSVLPQLQLDSSFAQWRMTVKSTAITDFFNNQAAAISETGCGTPQAHSLFLKKNLQKRLDKFSVVRHYS
ncbi:hypothetical protein IQ270_08730 [Microcoleus sp. LEGE 07076]|uniref:hypothetical protein n=1 Tax=Microcoleus sp. LEGE 07076 TaxID=915322 RepID=UPI00187E73D3|nr:hypothetical protein [Microcoleus sp. LEGE 07076]MBE9184793.1 hypothetical protein [Microcoleus sp. LEGE 07076]